MRFSSRATLVDRIFPGPPDFASAGRADRAGPAGHADTRFTRSDLAYRHGHPRDRPQGNGSAPEGGHGCGPIGSNRQNPAPALSGRNEREDHTGRHSGPTGAYW